MRIKKIVLCQFRNYEALSLDIGSDVTVFYGGNGQGKTNLLESVFLCAAGRSHRTSKDKEMIRFGAEEAAVAVRCERGDGERRIDMIIPAQGRKKIVLNGVSIVKIGELMGHINAVIFSPEDLQLVKDGPEKRRRFMDMEISQVKKTYFYDLQQYAKIVMQRNALLKTLYRQPAAAATLEAWDEQLARYALRIAKARDRFVERLQEEASALHRQISGGEALMLTYEPSISPEMSEEAVMRKLQEAREEDLRSGTSSLGPHRDNIEVFVQGRPARQYASQGQQRTAALAMKLSELAMVRRDTGEMPLLLLDDVMSELDEHRQAMLLEHTREAQLLVTCAAQEHIPQWGRDAHTVRIETGADGAARCVRQ